MADISHEEEFKRILSIQSHVVHGYVGNKAAVFPLQLQGWDVDAINSVQLSNHTAYGSFTGTRATAQEIKEIYQGLMERGFEYDAFLTGYVPGDEAVEEVGRIGQDLKQRFPRAIWLLDPVIGDDGKLYVSEECVAVYKSILKSGCVDLISPNGFEAELISGTKLDSIDNIKKALNILHTDYKVPNVVLSSVKLPGRSDLIAVSSGIDKFGNKYIHTFSFPSIEGYFTGTGDLFASLLIDRYYKCLNNQAEYPALTMAVKEVLAMMHAVLHKTIKHTEYLNNKIPKGLSEEAVKNEITKNRELQIIQSRHIILGKDLPSTSFIPEVL